MVVPGRFCLCVAPLNISLRKRLPRLTAVAFLGTVYFVFFILAAGVAWDRWGAAAGIGVACGLIVIEQVARSDAEVAPRQSH